MKAPNAPPSCPETFYASAVPMVEGAGAEQLQQAHQVAARDQLKLQASFMVNGTYGGNATRRAYADLATPQAFGSQPALVELAADAAIVQANPAAHSPGRAAPTVWDGEPGANAPTNEPW